jgi:hypothetical protein
LYCGREADADAESKNDDQRKSGVLEQHPDGEGEISS